MQFKYVDLEGGANDISLRQAQKNFIEFGACEREMLRCVRKPDMYDIKDEKWKVLSEE